ncbi:hypothetical protein JYU02_00685 [bacterium AH-315-P15]|nr:hypothetical protein [bacterium AH-315-P15]MBN4046494.1 hypothetical protein [bacterium AH-315-P15]
MNLTEAFGQNALHGALGPANRLNVSPFDLAGAGALPFDPRGARDEGGGTMRYLLGILCGLMVFAAGPAQAWELITIGPIEPSVLTGLDHRVGETTLSHYYGMDRNRPIALNDAVLPHFGIHRIQAGERNDRPCFLEIHFVSFTGGPPPDNQLSGRGEPFNRCGPDNVRRSSVDEVYSNPSRGYWATGLTACNARNGRLKGLRLRNTRFNYGPVLGNLIIGEILRDQFTRPNCRGNWSVNVSCLSGQVIVGLEVFYSREGGPEPDSIIGFRLHCRALDVRL